MMKPFNVPTNMYGRAFGQMPQQAMGHPALGQPQMPPQAMPQQGMPPQAQMGMQNSPNLAMVQQILARLRGGA